MMRTCSPPFVLLGLLVLAPLTVSAQTVEQAIAQSRDLAEQKQYPAALAILEQAQTSHPKDVELHIARIRVLSWQGNYSEAESALEALGATQDNNADVQLLRANLAYYRQDYPRAQQLYQDILTAHPDYVDAHNGLVRTQKAQAAPVHAGEYRWQIDTGYEHSGFDRVNQAAWNQEFLQLTHFAPGRKTAYHGKVTRYDQFRNVDTEYEIGMDHAFTNYVNGYAYGVISPGADFRPKRRVAAGGAVRVITAEDALPVWLTLDARYDIYGSTDVLNVNPGIRIEPVDGWSIATRYITVDQENAKRVYGQDVRLDGTISDTWRFYVGYADAPETVAAITVNTRTYFGGASVDITPQTVLRLGYARDDRENSFIRHVTNVSIGYRF